MMKGIVSFIVLFFIRLLIINGEFRYEYHAAKTDMKTAFEACLTSNGSLFAYNKNDPIPCKEAHLETDGGPTSIWIANYKRYSPWIYFKGCYRVDAKTTTINIDSITECVAQCTTKDQTSSVIAYNKRNRLCACQSDITSCGSSVPPNVCNNAVIMDRNTYLLFEVVPLNSKSSNCQVVQTAIHSTDASGCGQAIPYTFETLKGLNIANCYSGNTYDNVAGYFKLLLEDIAIDDIRDPVSCSVLKACVKGDSSKSVEDVPCNSASYGFVCKIEYTPTPTTEPVTTADVNSTSNETNKGETFSYATETASVKFTTDINTKTNMGETVLYSTKKISVRPRNKINTTHSKSEGGINSETTPTETVHTVIHPVVGAIGGLIFIGLITTVLLKIRKNKKGQRGEDYFKDGKDIGDKKVFDHYDKVADENVRTRKEYRNPVIETENDDYHVYHEIQDLPPYNIENNYAVDSRMPSNQPQTDLHDEKLPKAKPRVTISTNMDNDYDHIQSRHRNDLQFSENINGTFSDSFLNDNSNTSPESSTYMHLDFM